MSLEERHADETPACRVCAESPVDPSLIWPAEQQFLNHLHSTEDRAYLEGWLLFVLGADGVLQGLEAVHARRRARAQRELERAAAAGELGQPESTDD